MAAAPPRSPEQRKHDTLRRLENDLDAWVASADATGDFRLVPLSFYWDGATLTMVAGSDGPTGRNMRTTGRVRIAAGTTRDVVLIDGTVHTFTQQTVPDAVAEPFARKLWDARLDERPRSYFVVTPQRVLAWREENELPGRMIMDGGFWLI